MKKARLLPFFCIIAILMQSCKSCDTGYDFQEQLSVYLEKDAHNKEYSDQYSVYMDFSAPLVATQTNSEIKKTFGGILNAISSEDFKVFELGNDTIIQSEQDAKEIYQTLLKRGKPKNDAPIEKTLNRIVKEKTPALLVTDFEEHNNDIYKSAYAKEPFKKWLEYGGNITFYITPFLEGKNHKKLFYVVFDYPNNENSLLEKVKNGLDGNPVNYKVFTLSTNAYSIYNKYPSSTQGGNYHDENGDDVVSSVDEEEDTYSVLKEYNAESYAFGNNWADIVKNASNQTRSNGCKVPFTHLFRNLFIDMSNTDSYRISKISLKMYNVQKDFDKYWGYYMAKNHQPRIEEEEGEIYLDWNGNEEGKPYYDDKGNVLPEYDYSKGTGDIYEILDLLEFDNKLFIETFKKNPKEAEMGIKFVKGATGNILNESPKDDHLYRIDLLIDEVEMCELSRIESLFGWDGNNCMSESIKNTLMDMKPKGVRIYSYFIRIQ